MSTYIKKTVAGQVENGEPKVFHFNTSRQMYHLILEFLNIALPDYAFMRSQEEFFELHNGKEINEKKVKSFPKKRSISAELRQELKELRSEGHSWATKKEFHNEAFRLWLWLRDADSVCIST